MIGINHYLILSAILFAIFPEKLCIIGIVVY